MTPEERLEFDKVWAERNPELDQSETAPQVQHRNISLSIAVIDSGPGVLRDGVRPSLEAAFGGLARDGREPH